jgi:hypothetical protein
MAELFEKFEVNSDPRWKLVTRLLAGSLILHLALLWMAIYVPSVRDTLNIAALVASTKFVDKDYEATQIAENVQVVQLFRYPEGYFTPEGQVAAELPPRAVPGVDPFAPKIISQASSAPNVEPSPSPTPAASVSPEASPSASPVASPSGSPSTVAQASPSPLTQEEAQKQLEKTAEENKLPLPTENEINRKPLKDLAAHVNELKKQGKLDLNKPFRIVIQAKLDEKGKLIDAELIEKEGDDILQDLFKRMVSALNDSGLLIFLQPVSQDNPGAIVKITVQQGEKEVLASIESEASSAQTAEKLTRGFNGLLVAGAWARAGKDEAELMKNSTATLNGKKVVVNFSMPRQTVIDMLKKQLEPGV